MNIFVLDEHPAKAAQYHCDKHVIKQITETYQMLGSALRRHGAQDVDMPLTKSGSPLKGGYPNHPCTRWAGNTLNNFQWLCRLGLELCKEYTHRYGKKHFCEGALYKMFGISDHFIPIGDQTLFALAMPDEYRNTNPVKAYRDYYYFDKRVNIKCVWEKTRTEPSWWKSYEEEYK